MQKNEKIYEGAESKDAKKKIIFKSKKIIWQGVIHLWRPQKLQEV